MKAFVIFEGNGVCTGLKIREPPRVPQQMPHPAPVRCCPRIIRTSQLCGEGIVSIFCLLSEKSRRSSKPTFTFQGISSIHVLGHAGHCRRPWMTPTASQEISFPHGLYIVSSKGVLTNQGTACYFPLSAPVGVGGQRVSAMLRKETRNVFRTGKKWKPLPTAGSALKTTEEGRPKTLKTRTFVQPVHLTKNNNLSNHSVHTSGPTNTNKRHVEIRVATKIGCGVHTPIHPSIHPPTHPPSHRTSLLL